MTAATSVLTYPEGKPINWATMRSNPKRATVMTRWSGRTQGGKVVRGSLFVIAWLCWADAKARAKYGVGIVVIQACFNDTVAASAGTHDRDYCLDIWIPGVSGPEAQRFLRFECGAAFWYRTPAQGFSTHLHGFPLPPGGHVFPTQVGVFVDGGRSQNKSGYSSQIADYWAEAYGLAGLHYQSADPSPFPSDAAKLAGVFNLDKYIKTQERDTMDYKDWSDEGKREFWADAGKFLDSEKVTIKTKNGQTKDIPLRNAIARGANADPAA